MWLNQSLVSLNSQPLNPFYELSNAQNHRPWFWITHERNIHWYFLLLSFVSSLFSMFFFLVFLAKIAPPSLSLSPFVRLSSFLPSLLCSSLPLIIIIIIIIIINNHHHLFKAYPIKKMWLFICESPTKVLQGRQSTRFQKCFPWSPSIFYSSILYTFIPPFTFLEQRNYFVRIDSTLFRGLSTVLLAEV